MKKKENNNKEGNENDNDNEKKTENDESESEDSINLVINEETIEKAINMTVKNELNKRRVIPLVEVKWTIYESMIYNLRIIYHLMKLNTVAEGELPFDKLCVLTSNIIDFLIEYIDTKNDLNYIIDDNIKSLFFGNKKNDDKFAAFSNINKKGVFPIFTLKINDNIEKDEFSNKYKLRKTMIAYIKIKYIDLLKAYLQIGKKDEFIRLMLSNRLGPFQLFDEIIYYMKELINNLISKDYDKYHDLLNIEDIQSYIEKLSYLYKFDEDFRTSIEMSVILKICLIIATLEEVYNITMLKTYYKIEKQKESMNNNINNEKEITNEPKEENLEEEPEINIHFTSTKNELYYHPTYKSEDNLLDNFDPDNIDNATNFNYSPNKAVYQKINDTPYKKLKQSYNKKKDLEIKEENKKKEILLNKKKTKLDEDNLKLDSIFVKAVYFFLCSLVSKVEIRMVRNEEDKKDDNDKNNNYKYISNKISKELIRLKNKSKSLSRIVKNKKVKNNEI